MTRTPVTIRDVAARAGVSHQTVSRVINNSERVSPETRQKVEAAIAELGFQPNAIARYMAQGRTFTLACISPNLTDYTIASIIEGAETEARQQGYFVISASAPEAHAFNQLVEQLVASRRTDGLMVINPYIDQRGSMIPPNTPVVCVGAYPRDENIHSVALDEHKAGQTAAAHLLQLGHRQIATITGPMVEDCSQDRQAGFSATLKEAGNPLDSRLVVEGDWSATSGYQAARQLLESRIGFSALFAQNDRMAVGAIQALGEAGRNVPNDVSVIGFDDMPLASYFDPPLTTIHQDMALIGQSAARLLIGAIDQTLASPQHLRIPAELVVRRSTASVKHN